LLLLSISNARNFAMALDLTIESIEDVLNEPQYAEFSIPKKSGNKRIILKPGPELMYIQNRLNHLLQCYYYLIRPKEAHGFVLSPDKNEMPIGIVSNALPHVGKRTVLNIDLHNFFSTISAKQIKQLFLSDTFSFNDNIASTMALLCTYKGKLPTGTPTSPVLSNFICLPLDKALQSFCVEQDLTYTRYADDMTFSTMRKIGIDTVLDLIGIIRDHGFRINEKKLRMKGKGRRQVVTGLTVNEKVNPSKEMRKKVRAMRHDLETNGLESASKQHFKMSTRPSQELQEKFLNKLWGYESFLKQVREGKKSS
jgi:RNA-directed DNA polymerase